MTVKRKLGQRLGWRGYVTVLALLKQRPCTAQELASAIGMHTNTALQVTRRLQAVRLIHICGWQERDTKGGLAAQWRYGDGIEAPYPGKQRKPRPATSNNMASSVIALASVLRLLVEPISKGDILEATGINQEALRDLLDHMHELNLCRIGDWAPRLNGGAPAALWVLGSGQHKQRPARKPRALIHRERWEKRKARDLMQTMIFATAATRQPILEAA